MMVAGSRLRAWWRKVPSPVRMALVSVVGVLLIVLGTAMLVLPGPGVLVIAAGVALLASEFPWAASLLAAARAQVDAFVARLRRRGS